jgi:hypothetical protein
LSEANTCQWLNNIGDTLRQVNIDANYTNKDRQVITPFKRIWSSTNSSVDMKQHKSMDDVPHHKHDIVLIDDNFNRNISWLQVHTLTEVTHTELIKSWKIKDTVYQKFNVCDCSGIVYTTTLEIADHPLIFLCILSGLMFRCPSVVGYNETVQCDSCGKAVLNWVGRLDY